MAGDLVVAVLHPQEVTGYELVDGIEQVGVCSVREQVRELANVGAALQQREPVRRLLRESG